MVSIYSSLKTVGLFGYRYAHNAKGSTAKTYRARLKRSCYFYFYFYHYHYYYDYYYYYYYFLYPTSRRKDPPDLEAAHLHDPRSPSLLLPPAPGSPRGV